MSNSNDIAVVEPQILSDDSIAFNVRVNLHDDDRMDIRIGCINRAHADKLALALNQCTWIDTA